MMQSLLFITLASVGVTIADWTEECIIPDFAKTLSTATNLSSESALQALEASPDCHACDVQADGSGYYVPRLFYQHGNGRVEEVSNTGLSVRYTAYGSSAIAFPAGLTIMSGNPAAHTQDPIAKTGFTCYGNADFQNIFCPDGLTGYVDFQSCWDGQNLVKADNSHVAYLPANGICPLSHPVQLMSMYSAVVYKVNMIQQDGGHYFLANGDTTGYGYFGTFVSRWNRSVLAAAIKQCGTGNPLASAQSCPPLEASGIDTASRLCPSLPLSSTQVSSGFTTMTTSKASSTHSSSASTTPFSTLPSNPLTFVPVVNGKAFDGCYADDPTHHILDFDYTDAVGMTVLSCAEHCSEKYFGVVNGQDCYCGYEPYGGPQKVDNSECNVPCPGAPTESCGGVNRMVLYESG